MPKKNKIVQGTYISLECKKTIDREASRQEKHPSTLASEILERAAKIFLRKERKKQNENLQS